MGRIKDSIPRDSEGFIRYREEPSTDRSGQKASSQWGRHGTRMQHNRCTLCGNQATKGQSLCLACSGNETFSAPFYCARCPASGDSRWARPPKMGPSKQTPWIKPGQCPVCGRFDKFQWDETILQGVVTRARLMARADVDMLNQDGVACLDLETAYELVRFALERVPSSFDGKDRESFAGQYIEFLAIYITIQQPDPPSQIAEMQEAS